MIDIGGIWASFARLRLLMWVLLFPFSYVLTFVSLEIAAIYVFTYWLWVRTWTFKQLFSGKKA
jgi:hypothetical protein